MSYEPIDRDWLLANTGLRFSAHLNMGSVHVICRDLVDKRDGRPIGLGVNDLSYKRTKRNAEMGGRSERVWIVTGLDGECRTLDEAIEALDFIRDARAHAAAKSGEAAQGLPVPHPDAPSFPHAGVSAPKAARSRLVRSRPSPKGTVLA